MPRKKAPATRQQRAGRGHIYYLDGVKVPGVTTILGGGMPKPALIRWGINSVTDYVIEGLEIVDDNRGGEIVSADNLVSDLRRLNERRAQTGGTKLSMRAPAGRLPKTNLGKLLAQTPYLARDEAANRGTEVHKHAQSIADGDEILVEDVPPELRGHVRQYIDWLDCFDVAEAQTEVVVVNRTWRYMGQADLICDIPGIGRCLVDLKTGETGVYGEACVQVAMYASAEFIVDAEGNETPMPEIDACLILWLRAEGWTLYPLHPDWPIDRLCRIGLHARQIYDFDRHCDPRTDLPHPLGDPIVPTPQPAPTLAEAVDDWIGEAGE